MAEDLNAFSITGKVAIVTGGAAGIGLGIVQNFVKAGAKVLATGRRANGAEILEAAAPGAVYCQRDLADPDTPSRIVSAAVGAFGTVDILINNAVQNEYCLTSSYTSDFIDGMCAVNIRAVLLLIQAFVAHRQTCGGGGRIINISSIEGMVTTMPAGMGIYSATKAAVRGLTVSLAHELAPLDIRVNAIAPGAVVHENMFEAGAARGFSREVIEQGLENMRSRTHCQRLGTPDDIAHGCVFLASPASDYISGQTLVVDGGVTVNGC